MAETIADLKKYAKAVADDNTRYYGLWDSTYGNGVHNVPAGFDDYPKTFDCSGFVTYCIKMAKYGRYSAYETQRDGTYTFPDNQSDHYYFDRWLLNTIGAYKFSWSSVGWGGLQEGDIVIGYEHMWIYYSRDDDTLVDANPHHNGANQIAVRSASANRYSDCRWVYRLPWDAGARNLWIGVNNQPKQVKKMWIGVNGQAKEVKHMWIGVNGQTKKVF